MHSSRRTRSRAATLALGAAVVTLTAALSGCTAPGSASDDASPVVVATTEGTPVDVVIAAGHPAVLEFPAVGAGGVGIASADGTVDVLGQGGDTGTMPIASITKVITALVVLDAHPLADTAESVAAGSLDPGPTITLGEADLEITAAVEAADQFTEPMYDGQEVSLRDALAITLLTSANNYAESVAAWAFGSQEAYLTAARAWLADQGLTATTLADASGLDPGSASSTADLLHVASLAHANVSLASIAGLATLDQVDLGTLANQNILLGENGVDGLKTGSTSYAGFTLLTSARVVVGATPVTLVSVVLGTESLDARFATTQALVASAQAGLREVPLAAAGQVFGRYSPADGSGMRNAVAAEPLTSVVFGDTPVTVQIALDDLGEGAEAAIGSRIGSATFTSGASRWSLELTLAGG